VALGDVAWCALAESLGIPSRLVTSEREVERELREALGRAGPTLLEARVEAGSYAAIIRAVRG
jgi:thiamine pyrophosphate-dependent acetolactate synthase large subunit-like protein